MAVAEALHVTSELKAKSTTKEDEIHEKAGSGVPHRYSSTQESEKDFGHW